MYKITLPINFSGFRYGIEFFKGVGETDDERITQIMRNKGFVVEPVSDFGFTPEPEEDKPRRGRPKAEE